MQSLKTNKENQHKACKINQNQSLLFDVGRLLSQLDALAHTTRQRYVLLLMLGLLSTSVHFLFRFSMPDTN